MRMKKLEEIRLEVDSRRRTVQELTIKVQHDSWSTPSPSRQHETGSPAFGPLVLLTSISGDGAWRHVQACSLGQHPEGCLTKQLTGREAAGQAAADPRQGRGRDEQHHQDATAQGEQACRYASVPAVSVLHDGATPGHACLLGQGDCQEDKAIRILSQSVFDAHSAAARQSFKEHEALVYQQLAQLIRDGVWLKSYIAAVMRVEQASHTCNVILYHLALLAGM